MKNITKIISLLLIVGLFLYGVGHVSSVKKTHSSTLQKEVIEVPNGYGYQIFSGNKLLVQQEYIPAVKGNKPFQSRKDAKRVADLVIEKILSRQSPQITLEELNSLEILILED